MVFSLGNLKNYELFDLRGAKFAFFPFGFQFSFQFLVTSFPFPSKCHFLFLPSLFSLLLFSSQFLIFNFYWRAPSRTLCISPKPKQGARCVRVGLFAASPQSASLPFASFRAFRCYPCPMALRMGFGWVNFNTGFERRYAGTQISKLFLIFTDSALKYVYNG
jgi:hypothetical protein